MVTISSVATTDSVSTTERSTTPLVTISSVSTTDSPSTTENSTTPLVTISSVSTTDTPSTIESSTIPLAPSCSASKTDSVSVMSTSKAPLVCTQSCPRGLIDIRSDKCRCCVIDIYDDYVEFMLEIEEMKNRYILTGSSDQQLAEYIVLFDARLEGLNNWIIETCEAKFEKCKKLD